MSGITGSHRQPLDGPSQAQIIATRREKRAVMLADLRRRRAAAHYAIERILNELGTNGGRDA